jgi:hypothetical protein
MIELWTRDEYGQGTIMGRYSDFSKAFNQAISHISAQNLDNALTNEERMRNWECYMPVCVDDSGCVVGNIYFAGKKGGKIPYFIDENGSEVNPESVRIMLGKSNKLKDDVFLQDVRKRFIVKMDDPSLNNKAFVFFKHIK